MSDIRTLETICRDINLPVQPVIIRGVSPSTEYGMTAIRAVVDATTSAKEKTAINQQDATITRGRVQAQAAYDHLVDAVHRGGEIDDEDALTILDAAGKTAADVFVTVRNRAKREADASYTAMVLAAAVGGNLPSRGHAEEVCRAAGETLANYQIDLRRLGGRC